MFWPAESKNGDYSKINRAIFEKFSRFSLEGDLTLSAVAPDLNNRFAGTFYEIEEGICAHLRIFCMYIVYITKIGQVILSLLAKM